MKINQKSADERAVSPVIGVILMVAITVILAAVIGTFVMGIGQDASQSAPQASLSVEVNTVSNHINVTHDGGDGLADKDTKILVTAETNGSTATFSAGSSDTTWTVGNQVDLEIDAGNVTSSTFSGRSAQGGYADTTFGLGSGNQYTLKIIDTNSQRTIFETTVTA